MSWSSLAARARASWRGIGPGSASRSWRTTTAHSQPARPHKVGGDDIAIGRPVEADRARVQVERAALSPARHDARGDAADGGARRDPPVRSSRCRRRSSGATGATRTRPATCRAVLLHASVLGLVLATLRHEGEWAARELRGRAQRAQPQVPAGAGHPGRGRRFPSGADPILDATELAAVGDRPGAEALLASLPALDLRCPACARAPRELRVSPHAIAGAPTLPAGRRDSGP